MTRMKNRKAFTLIELVVVIVIIAILAAIAAFAYNSVITNSKKSALDNSAKQVAKSVAAWSATNNTAPASMSEANFNASITGDSIPNAYQPHPSTWAHKVYYVSGSAFATGQPCAVVNLDAATSVGAVPTTTPGTSGGTDTAPTCS